MTNNRDDRKELIRALLGRLERLYGEAREIEELLGSLGEETEGILNLDEFAKVHETLKRLEAAESLAFALARVDFQDDYYAFVRAIDGDTIVVEPPKPLQQWLRDVRVRLYGLETPELWEELGSEYRAHLEEICAIDAGGRLMIVWERERAGTQYEGFPLSSFERGIGHVFFRVDDRFLYVNNLMQLLKHSSLRRDGKSLLRGRRILSDAELRLPWRGTCATVLRSGSTEPSQTFMSLQGIRPPVCLLSYPKLPSLDPRHDRTTRLSQLLAEGSSFGCPFEPDLRRAYSGFVPQIERQRMSPFDIPLILLSQWLEQMVSQGDSESA